MNCYLWFACPQYTDWISSGKVKVKFSEKSTWISKVDKEVKILGYSVLKFRRRFLWWMMFGRIYSMNSTMNLLLAWTDFTLNSFFISPFFFNTVENTESKYWNVLLTLSTPASNYVLRDSHLNFWCSQIIHLVGVQPHGIYTIWTFGLNVLEEAFIIIKLKWNILVFT